LKSCVNSPRAAATRKSPSACHAACIRWNSTWSASTANSPPINAVNCWQRRARRGCWG